MNLSKYLRTNSNTHHSEFHFIMMDILIVDDVWENCNKI